MLKPKHHFPGDSLKQGYGCGSVEGMPGRPAGFQRIADHSSRHGYVTLGVEKPGCGDSEGGPCHEVDFPTELDGYRQGLKALKADDGVDPARIVLFGHSLGGIRAPMVAADDPVRVVLDHGFAPSSTPQEAFDKAAAGTPRGLDA